MCSDTHAEVEMTPWWRHFYLKKLLIADRIWWFSIRQSHWF